MRSSGRNSRELSCVWVSLNGGTKRLVERTFYGELVNEPTANLRGHIFAQLDGAGLVQYTAYDFKGNLLVSARQLATSVDPTNLAWTDIADSAVTTALAPVGVNMAESFVTTTAYDALNRVTSLRVPSSTGGADHSATPTYNRTGLLDTMSVRFVGSTAAIPFVTGIENNEKEQRKSITYGNGVVTKCTPSEFESRSENWLIQGPSWVHANLMRASGGPVLAIPYGALVGNPEPSANVSGLGDEELLILPGKCL